MTSRVSGDGWTGRLEQLAALVRMDALAIVLPSRDTPTTYAAFNTSNLAWPNTPAAATVANVLSQRQPAQLGGTAMPLADGRSAESLTVTPILWKDQLVGALVGMAARSATDEDVRVLARAADLIAIDLGEANVVYRAQRAAQDVEGRMRAARDLGRVVRQGDPSAILERAVGHLAELFSADGVSIMLIENAELAIRSSRGLSDEAKRSRRAIGEGISGGVARSGQPTLLIGPISGAVDQTVSESMIVPLRAAERTIGVVNVKHRAPQSRYAQAQLDALALFAQDIASAYSTALELQGAIDDRQQAIVLYELSRFASL